MKKIYLLMIMMFAVAISNAHAQTFFISEFHYDNNGADANERIEVFGPAGVNASGLSLVLYNGANGDVYATIALSGIFPNLCTLGGIPYGVLVFDAVGLQNGSPDGIALASASAGLIEFISYEGSFTADQGVANGITSTDIGAIEDASGTADGSIQRLTTGNAWVTNNTVNSFGACNISEAPLPVKFYNVKASPLGTGIKIEWSNLTETDVNNYTIERSADGQLFTALSELTATKNDGGRADYSYLDALPLNGVSYYRIRSTEFDGAKLYSIIVRVSPKDAVADIVIYPNPVTGGLLSLQATQLVKGDYTISIFNAGGQQVHQQRFSHNGGFVTQSVQLPATINAGMYSLQVSSSEMKLTKAFIIR